MRLRALTVPVLCGLALLAATPLPAGAQTPDSLWRQAPAGDPGATDGGGGTSDRTPALAALLVAVLAGSAALGVRLAARPRPPAEALADRPQVWLPPAAAQGPPAPDAVTPEMLGISTTSRDRASHRYDELYERVYASELVRLTLRVERTRRRLEDERRNRRAC